MHIHLKDLRFFAHHGYYPHEKEMGNDFVVNVHIGFQPETPEVVTTLSETINYELVYQMVSMRMQEPTPLLETICGELVRMILDDFATALHAEVSIEKLNPPISGMRGSVVVVESLHRHMPDAVN